MLRLPSFFVTALRRSSIIMASASFEQEPLFEAADRVWGWKSVRCLASNGGRWKSRASVCPSTDAEKFPKRLLALEATLSEISNTFGGGTVMWLGRDTRCMQVSVVSTGSLALDAALGVGGLPRGRVVEIFGPEASGKRTLALHIIAEAQKTGGRCIFIDAKHALDPSFAEVLGVVTNDLLIARPDSGEQALNLVDQFVRNGTVDVIVVDNVAALVPQAELEGEMGAVHMALQARLMSQSLRKLTHSISKSNALIIFLNQTRSKLGSSGFEGGPMEVTSGGNALKFYASVRLNIHSIGQLKVGEKVVGSKTLAKVVKNKLAPPFKVAEFEIEFGKGISKEGEVIDQALKFGLIKELGGWHQYNDQQMGNGRENAKQYLREHNELYQNLLSQIKAKLLGEAKA